MNDGGRSQSLFSVFLTAFQPCLLEEPHILAYWIPEIFKRIPHTAMLRMRQFLYICLSFNQVHLMLFLPTVSLLSDSLNVELQCDLLFLIYSKLLLHTHSLRALFIHLPVEND